MWTRSQPGGSPPPTTTARVVDYVNDHLVDYVNVTPSHLVDSVNADSDADLEFKALRDRR